MIDEHGGNDELGEAQDGADNVLRKSQSNSSQEIYFGTYTDDDPYRKSIHSSHPMIEHDLRYILDC